MDLKKHTTSMLALALAVLVLAVYWRTSGYEFISLDDEIYIVKNPLVREGLTLEGIKGAFSYSYRGLRHLVPLTLISYMAEVSAWGLNPGYFHLTNTVLFLANVVLLFLFLRYATGSAWKSFFAVALWAMHPLRVESVAWVAERKDMLSGLFFILALWSHLLYVRTGKLGWYAAVIVSAVLGTLAKPVLVVLPVALLLLDFWPLGRFPADGSRKEKLRAIKRLVLEKTPLIVLSLVSSAVTLYVSTADNPSSGATLFQGIATAAVGYWKYLGRTFFPRDLIFEYAALSPSPGAFAAFVSLATLAAVSAAAFMLRRRAPEVAFGWFWFLLLLFPNSGIVTPGLQNFADRFTYLPHVGLFAALVWGVARVAGKVEGGEKMAALPGIAAVLILAAVSATFTGYWKNSYTYLGRIDELYGGKNVIALVYLTEAGMNEGKPDIALGYLNRLEKADPHYPTLRQKKFAVLYGLERYDDALSVLQEELAVNPQNASAREMISTVLKEKAERAKGRGNGL